MAAPFALHRTVAAANSPSLTTTSRSFLEVASVIEVQSRRQFERHPLGSEADLRAAMAGAAQETSNPFKAVMQAMKAAGMPRTPMPTLAGISMFPGEQVRPLW